MPETAESRSGSGRLSAVEQWSCSERLAFRHRPWLSFGLITVGCLAGAVATMWTLVIPLVALAVIVLALL
jgi:hypothetical protein